MLVGFDALTAYPIASVSAALFYVVLIALAVPGVRAACAPWLTPIVSQKHLAGFDTFRGLAAALVALGHGWWATYPVFDASRDWLPFLNIGHKGVPIFCVLSGFLIYRAVLAIDTIDDFRAYAIRRFFRIYPVYLLSVVICAVLLVYAGTDRFTATQFFFSDLFMFRVLRWPEFGNPVAWSLYAEVAFYLALPPIVMIFRPRRMLAFCIVALAVMLLADHTSREYSIWRFFLYGIVAACISHRLRTVALPLFALGVILLVLDFCGPRYDWGARLVGHRHPTDHTIGIGVACTLILATLPHLRTIGRALDVFPLRLVGLISYSLYVTHLFFIAVNFPMIGAGLRFGGQENYQVLLTFPKLPVWYLPLVFFPGMLAWALVSYLLVERPGIALGRTIVGRRGRVGAAAQPAE